MKLLSLALTAALLALTSTGAAAQEFESVVVEKIHNMGPRAGTSMTIRVESTGDVLVSGRAAGKERTPLSGTATSSELSAVRRAFRAAHVESLPGELFAIGESTGTLFLDAVLPGGQKTHSFGQLDLYGEHAPRVEPLLAALDAIAKRLVSEVRTGFQQVSLVTRATGGPTPGATSALNVASTGRARLDRRLPGAPPALAEGQATVDELKRVAAALGAADLASIPDGLVADPRAGESLAHVILVVVGADGKARTINARRGFYGKHLLADLVDALEAIAKRLATSSPTGDVAGAVTGAGDGLRGLTGALRGR